ncbi:MAG: hypothetical protein A2W85_13690 [Bacteroidetes bacterium GWF2_41_31]|nr:MAG: hypothetical protein A2W85_13690 [Bacteroidetes bacterium GWF2_41_31]OFZ08724.1 MAG: hypothetical protein A2338_02950 [Bacteroidetes bacterium RIFOXYB12_FULL_41_6]
MLVATITYAESCKKDEPKVDTPIIVAEDSSVTDYDGNTYRTVKIGNQIWMAENLRSTHYSDGSTIQFFNYNNDEANVSVYGRLYTWSAAMNGAASSNANPGNTQGIAPVGWHLPSTAEWQQLINYLGGSSVAGSKLKESGTVHWLEPNTGTNEIMFNALPAGFYFHLSEYTWKGTACIFTTSTTNSSVLLQNNSSTVVIDGIEANDGISVRCVKN